MSEKYGNAIRNERRHFFPVEFIYHNNHLCECRAIREISFFSLWSFSRATHRGLGVCELYFASTSIYENEREREREKGSVYVNIYACIHVDRIDRYDVRREKEKVRIEPVYCNCFYLCILELYILRTRPEFASST